MYSPLKNITAVFILVSCFSANGFAQQDAVEPVAAVKRSLVMAHYMPWYSSDPPNNRYGWHWTMNHFDPKKQNDGLPQLASKYHPLLGAYDSGNPAVIECHLLTMKLAGIDGVIVDWYGLTNNFDHGMLHENSKRLVSQLERFGMKLIICYEDQTLPALVKAKVVGVSETVPHVAEEIRWLSKHWFAKDFYVKFNNDPVLLSFGDSGLSNEQWTQCIESLDFPVCYVSEHTRRTSAKGAFDWPIPDRGLSYVTQFLKQSQDMQIRIPVAFPRFDDIYKTAGVSDGYVAIADNQGRTFAKTMELAMSSGAPMIQIATWNDWGEGTQIEPSHESGYRDLIHLQNTYPNDFVTATSATGDDLKIALEIYELRKQNGVPKEKIDSVVNALLNADLESARAQLAILKVDSKDSKR